MKNVTQTAMAMKNDEITEYFHETLGLAISLARWDDTERLPLYLRDGYTFYQTEIMNVPCLLMAGGENEDRSPATIRKHMDHVRSKWNGEVVYVRRQVAAYQRKRLIEQKVPFMIPGNQMYMPMLGIDLREHFRTRRQSAPTLSPATQVVVLNELLHGNQTIYTPIELAVKLGYSKMTMTRALNELEAKGLGDIFTQGRERCLKFGDDRRETWQKALPLLRSPVKQSQHILPPTETSFGCVAGLSALARYSMLAAPPIPVIAMTAKNWKMIQQLPECARAAADDPDSHEIEIWSHDPELFSEEKVVDRLSLFLSLRDNDDERIESALEEMMETVSW